MENKYPFWTTKKELKVFCDLVKFNADVKKKYSCTFCNTRFKTTGGADNHLFNFHFAEVRERILEA